MTSSSFLLLLLLFPSLSLGFFEDLKKSLTEAQTYIKDSVPYISEVYEKLVRVQEFTDSMLDEECPYVCPRPAKQKAVPNRAHFKTANGCGALNYIFDHTDASPVRLDKEFTDCCNEHDFCYDTCHADKDLCDLELKKCMYKVCRANKGGFLKVRQCKVNAKGAYLLVMALGCQLYRDSQKEACVCVPRDEL